jgi:phage regulator Rha-like protein
MNETQSIQSIIYELRGRKIMLDSDLARLYEIETKDLNRAVKRNMARFPDFFMFQLTDAEIDNLRCQIGAAKLSRKRRFNPYAFTEQGVAMLSSVLNSEKAIKMNIQIMVTFVQMRQIAVTQTDTNEQITELRKLLILYIEKNDKRVDDILRVLSNFIAKPPTQKTIGFKTD